MKRCDFLIIGSGLAGLSCAVKLAERHPGRKVVVATKADQSDESNTKYAQGGVAVVWDQINDSYRQHIEDTLRAGDDCCNPEIVKMVVMEGPERLKELIEWGAEFDRKKTGDFDLGLEGGHVSPRIIHHKDITGYEIEKTLLARAKHAPNIELLDQHFTLDLLTQRHLGQLDGTDKACCYGAYMLSRLTRRVEAYVARMTILASGGSGQVYKTTTNPAIATGDGVAMAYRAKAAVSGMEFIQFHPTALYQPTADYAFLISEAVRGFGALLRNRSGELFMHRYDARRELASRDIVSRAIDSELKKSGDECVYMDCRHLDMEDFGEKFPNIKQKCEKMGLNLALDMIPVAPAAHYFCGGIDVDQDGKTTIENLLACGECTHTGLHGANRLASNSLLEALVFAHRCSAQASETIGSVLDPPPFPSWSEEGTVHPREHILITHNRGELRALMSNYVGIVRSYERLRRAARRIKILYEETEELYRKTRISPQLFELRNMTLVSHLIVEQSLARKENRGVFYNADIAPTP